MKEFVRRLEDDLHAVRALTHVLGAFDQQARIVPPGVVAEGVARPRRTRGCLGGLRGMGRRGEIHDRTGAFPVLFLDNRYKNKPVHRMSLALTEVD